MTEPYRESGLGYLMGSYFHQDWDIDADTWQGVVAHYVSEESMHSLFIDAMGEISIVTATTIADDDPRFLYDTFRCEHSTPTGMTANEWLNAIRDRIADELQAAGRLEPTQIADVLMALDSCGIRRPTNGTNDALSLSAAFGATAPLEEVVALLGSVSLALAPSAPTDLDTRAWLDIVRGTVAARAAARWRPTADR